jgi:hypothetical protein
MCINLVLWVYQIFNNLDQHLSESFLTMVSFRWLLKAHSQMKFEFQAEFSCMHVKSCHNSLSLWLLSHVYFTKLAYLVLSFVEVGRKSLYNALKGKTILQFAFLMCMGISQVRPAETHCCTCISNVQLKMITHLRWIVSNPLKQKLCKLAQRYWCKKKWSRILQNCSQIETTNKVFFLKILQESLHKFMQQAKFF